MSLPNGHKICLVLLFLSTLAQSRKLINRHEKLIKPKIYKLIERNNRIFIEEAESKKYNKNNLLEFLHNNANLEYRVNNILNRQDERNSGLKKKWVRRIVPYNKESPDTAFDSNFGLIFKPLVRLHKTRKVHLNNAGSVPKLDKVQRELNVLRMKFQLDELRGSMKREKTYTPEAGQIMHMTREADEIIGSVGVRYIRNNLHKILKYHHKKILPRVKAMQSDIINYLNEENKRQLRGGAPKMEELCALGMCTGQIKPMSGSDGKIHLFVDGQKIPLVPENHNEMPPPLSPNKPIWDQWTYKTTILEDECGLGAMQLGNICIWIPQHRRLLRQRSINHNNY